MISKAKLLPANYPIMDMPHPRSANLRIFCAKVQVGEICLGVSYGATKTEAGHKAAMCALKNPGRCLQVGLHLQY
ncbi:hypothetical protein Cantr_09986 [Candida viswanathii]|uniref:DRBM domain-containing protein n=1 Tax=Candida viswanathii TaxID=5486 RepID=A0A367YC99_9ASCO|nr:hypothetical protein Cantr_09986 [Candida viswanathii]